MPVARPCGERPLVRLHPPAAVALRLRRPTAGPGRKRPGRELPPARGAPVVRRGRDVQESFHVHEVAGAHRLQLREELLLESPQGRVRSPVRRRVEVQIRATSRPPHADFERNTCRPGSAMNGNRSRAATRARARAERGRGGEELLEASARGRAERTAAAHGRTRRRARVPECVRQGPGSKVPGTSARCRSKRSARRPAPGRHRTRGALRVLRRAPASTPSPRRATSPPARPCLRRLPRTPDRESPAGTSRGSPRSPDRG
jgi:hypothetical protein